MELISWIATGVVLLSFLFEGFKLRLINGMGALMWIIWGIGTHQPAVIFLNVMIVSIHIYKLSIEKKSKSFYSVSRLKKFLKNRHGS